MEILKRLVPKKSPDNNIWTPCTTGSCKTWTGLESGLWTGLESGLWTGLESGLWTGLDYGLDWTGLEEVWVQLLLAIDYFIRDREVLVLWLQVSRSPGCCVICRCRSGYTRLGAVGVVSAV